MIDKYFSLSSRFSQPAQPGIIQLTIDFGLISILRIQDHGLRHISSLRKALRQTEDESQNQNQEEDTFRGMQNDGEPVTVEAFTGKGKYPTR